MDNKKESDSDNYTMSQGSQFGSEAERRKHDYLKKRSGLRDHEGDGTHKHLSLDRSPNNLYDDYLRKGSGLKRLVADKKFQRDKIYKDVTPVRKRTFLKKGEGKLMHNQQFIPRKERFRNLSTSLLNDERGENHERRRSPRRASQVVGESFSPMVSPVHHGSRRNNRSTLRPEKSSNLVDHLNSQARPKDKKSRQAACRTVKKNASAPQLNEPSIISIEPLMLPVADESKPERDSSLLRLYPFHGQTSKNKKKEESGSLLDNLDEDRRKLLGLSRQGSRSKKRQETVDQK